jgi:hypothetical protein
MSRPVIRRAHPFLAAAAVALLPLLPLLPSQASAQAAQGAGGASGQVARQTAESPAAPRRLATPSRPTDAKGREVLAAANAHRGLKIMVSTHDRWLWLVSPQGDTLMSVSVAIGMNDGFTFEGRRFFFQTPKGERRVLSKAPNPVWTVPEWNYMRRAMARDYDLVRLTKETKYLLEDGSFILTIGEDVGRLNQYGHFYRFPPGTEIMFDGKVFMPPFGTNQRRVPEALGPYKLDTGDGYLLHGTHIYNEDSIGEAVSHGCVRLTNEDVTRLYRLTPVGTPVFIF